MLVDVGWIWMDLKDSDGFPLISFDYFGFGWILGLGFEVSGLGFEVLALGFKDLWGLGGGQAKTCKNTRKSSKGPSKCPLQAFKT